MYISPFSIATARAEETVPIGNHVKVTVFDLRLDQVCLGVIAPAGMTVSSSPARKLFEAKDGTRMAPLRVGDSLSIGTEVMVLVLAAKDGKVRLGLSRSTADLARKHVNANRRGGRVNKPSQRGRRRRGNHIHGVF